MVKSHYFFEFLNIGQPHLIEETELEQALGTTAGAFPQPLANILKQRGIADLESAKRFLQPNLSQLHDPMSMMDMDKAVARILQALEKNERILIYGDYDVDGTTSVALLHLFFLDLGFSFEIYVPDKCFCAVLRKSSAVAKDLTDKQCRIHKKWSNCIIYF